MLLPRLFHVVVTVVFTSVVAANVPGICAQEKQEREDEIERDNQRLLVRLVKAMTTKRVDNWNEVDNQLYVYLTYIHHSTYAVVVAVVVIQFVSLCLSSIQSIKQTRPKFKDSIVYRRNVL